MDNFATETSRRTEQAAPKVLMELRNCSIGFAGISQETRLVYSALCQQPDVQVGGLLNPFHDLILPGKLLKQLHTGIESTKIQPWKEMYLHNRLVYALDWETEGRRRSHPILKLWKRLDKKDSLPTLISYMLSGKTHELLSIHSELFNDFVWTKYFQQTLSERYKEGVLSTPYYTIEKGWNDANIFCRKRKTACKINTRGWDFFFCQVPTPFMVSPETQIVVRYHDSIPLLLPHTVDSQESKRFFWRLRASIRNGAFFACTSEPVRQELVRLFPETESTSTVVPDMVADSYYKEEPQPKAVSTILQSRRCPETAPERPASRLPKVIKDPFLFSVSTLEPRKNFRLLLQAWAYACARLEGKPMLVLVANLGWRHHEDIMEVKALVKTGRVAHLTRVPISEMRLLYSAAHAVVCPSRSEGFDLSGIEAMLCDTPVLASDIDVHRWVYGDAAVYFKSYDVGHCADQIVRALSTPKESDYLADLRQRGRQHAALYTRETIGPKWTELFQRLSSKAITPRSTVVSAAVA